jgi:hypothetical protein
MPRFVSTRDVRFFQSINKELIDDVIETTVLLYKLSSDDTSTNIYGEAKKKIYFQPIQVACLIERDQTAVASEGFGLETTQSARFKFYRTTLEEVGFYPESGDFIFFNEGYYEIDNANEEQLVAGQPTFVHSIICETHLTRRSSLNIDSRQV